MEAHFFDTDFKFERYIEERLLEISDEEERRQLKELLKDTLIPFYQRTEDAYHGLEKRLLASKENRQIRYELITGIMERDTIDITDNALVPMKIEDIYEQTVNVEELQTCLQNNDSYTVMQVFLQMDSEQIQMLEKENRILYGRIYTEDEEYPASFRLSRNWSYLKPISELYQIFVKNNLEWNTVCAPYLYKYFDVKILGTECPLDTPITKITVDFEEYKNDVRYNLIPVWNITTTEERSSAYPAFAFDRIHYEHTIYRERFQKNRDYLITNKQIKVWNIFHTDGDMHILCDEDKPVLWSFLELNYGAHQKQYQFPVFGNYHNGEKGCRCIHTYGEVKRYIKELGYEAYLELVEVKQVQEYSEKDRQTYSMDWFVADEIRIAPHRPYMLFQFKAADEGSYLNKDIMSYLVSNIQWQLPEYDCVGELL